jgi:hypothetical protein
VFASDPISPNAYATEAIMSVLVALGSGALVTALPLGLAVAGLVPPGKRLNPCTCRFWLANEVGLQILFK